MKLKEQIKKILEENNSAKNNDNSLIVRYLRMKGITNLDELENSNISLEAITRARRSLQNEFPELKADKEVQKYRKIKEKEMYNEYISNCAYNKVII